MRMMAWTAALAALWLAAAGCGRDYPRGGSGYIGNPVYPEPPDGDGDGGAGEGETGGCDPNPCLDPGRGVCFAGEDGPACHCDPGLTDYGDGRCLPLDPCAGDTLCAGRHRACNNEAGEAVCGDCLGGWHDQESECVADSACTGSTCSGHGECSDQGGRPACDCASPWRGSFCEECAVPEGWPPAEPWWSGAVCRLPACDEAEPLCFDPSGSWRRTLTTTASNCNPALANFDARTRLGNVDTTEYELGFAGGCDLKEGAEGTIAGVVHGNVHIICDINIQTMEVRSLETAVVAFAGDRGTGTARIFLSSVPIFGDCDMTMDVVMERVR